MAFSWSDIRNNEKAQSVRSKLNALGQKMSTESQRIDSESQRIDGIQNDIDTMTPQITALNSMITIATNVTCAVNQWGEDSAVTYEDYPFKADVYIPGITGDMVPLVNFSATDQASGNFIGADSATNIITIWAKEKPEETFVIPNVVLIKEA